MVNATIHHIPTPDGDTLRFWLRCARYDYKYGEIAEGQPLTSGTNACATWTVTTRIAVSSGTVNACGSCAMVPTSGASITTRRGR